MDWLEVGYYVFLVIAVVLINRAWDNAIKRKQEKDVEEKIRKMETNKQDAKEKSPEMQGEVPVSSESGTMVLLTETMKQLNLEVVFDEEDKDAVRTIFQGEHLIIRIENNKFIEVRDLFWYEAPLDDLDNLSIIQKTLNWCNLNTTCRMIYSRNDEEKTINIHTLVTLLWIPEIPDLDQYLGATLMYMLQVKGVFYSTMERIRREVYERINTESV
jgi:hypothetical protein